MSGRSPRAARLLVVLAWALAAVLAGTVVWWAVAEIGGTSGAARSGVLSQSQVAALAAQATAPPVVAASSPSAPAPATAAASSPAPVTPAPSSPAPSTPVPSSPAPSTPAPVTAAPPTPAEVVRTWDVPGGQVAASCRGAQIGLLYATPQDGWSVEVKNSGPAQVVVKFDREDAETTVRAACRDGVPDKQVDAGKD